MTPPMFRQLQTSRFKILWDAFKKSALLEPELIKLAWGEDPKNIFLNHRDLLLDIMEKFGLIASPPSESQQKESQHSKLYYVPAMFEDPNPSWLEPTVKEKDTRLSCSVCFVFNSTVPFTIMDKVLAFCIQKFEPFDIPTHDCSKCLQRCITCFKVKNSLNMIFSYSESVAKATLLKCGSTVEFKQGDGYEVLCTLKYVLGAAFEMCSQQHFQFEYFLHSDYLITVDERRVPIGEINKTAEDLYCWNRYGKQRITKTDYAIWFKEPVSF